MEYYLHIKPNFKCVIQIENIKKELEEGVISTFLVNSSVLATVYPLMPYDNNSSTYTFAIVNSENIEITKSPTKLIKFDENNYLLMLYPFYVKIENSPTKILTFNNYKVYYNEKPISISVEKNDKSISFSNSQNVRILKYKEKNNNIVLYGKTIDNKYFFSHLICEDDFKIIRNEEVDMLSENNKEIITYKKLNDFSKHGIQTNYTFSPNFSKQTKIVYDKDKPFISKKREIIPFAFFEAVKIKNYKLARHYLTERLSEKLDDNHIKSFFEDFEFCHQTLSKDFNENEIALIYKYSVNNYIAKIINIEFDNTNKINNITFK